MRLFLDLNGLRRHLVQVYGHTGRPSIDTELTIRMLIVGYCFGIRSGVAVDRLVYGFPLLSQNALDF